MSIDLIQCIILSVPFKLAHSLDVIGRIRDPQGLDQKWFKRFEAACQFLDISE